MLLQLTVDVTCLIGFLLMMAAGYGWIWGTSLRSVNDVRTLVKSYDMRGFYVGLTAYPLLVAMLLSFIFKSVWIFVIVGVFVCLPFILLKIFHKNLFVPLLCICGILLSFFASTFVRVSFILITFLLYLGAIIIAPLLLALFLSAI